MGILWALPVPQLSLRQAEMVSCSQDQLEVPGSLDDSSVTKGAKRLLLKVGLSQI